MSNREVWKKNYPRIIIVLKILALCFLVPEYIYRTGYAIGSLVGRNYQLFHHPAFQALLSFLEIAQWIVLILLIAFVWRFPERSLIEILEKNPPTKKDAILAVCFVLAFSLFQKKEIMWTVSQGWHLFHSEQILFEDVIIHVPRNWFSIRKPDHIVFCKVPHTNEEPYSMVILRKGLMEFEKMKQHTVLVTENKYYELKGIKRESLGGMEAFGARYNEKCSNEILEFWSIPSMGYYIQIADVPESLYPSAWEFVRSNFHFVKK